MSPWMESIRTVRRAVRGLALPALLALLAVGLVACGGSSATGGSEEGSGGGGGAAAGDSFMAAYPTAQEAMAAVADDAVLLAAGTGGLALADVPDNWNFTYLSPAGNTLYTVSVEHGKASEPRELAEAPQGAEITQSIDPASIKVGAAQAVVDAREYGSAKGDLPRNVMVGGTLALTPQTKDAGMSIGVWEVTFATGTDLADAQKFTVDMMTGEVAAAE